MFFRNQVLPIFSLSQKCQGVKFIIYLQHVLFTEGFSSRNSCASLSKARAGLLPWCGLELTIVSACHYHSYHQGRGQGHTNARLGCWPPVLHRKIPGTSAVRKKTVELVA